MFSPLHPNNICSCWWQWRHQGIGPSPRSKESRGVCLPWPLPSSHSETLPVEFLGGQPLCMNQYYQILSSCRVPGPKQDSVVNFLKAKKPPTHITVVHNYQVGITALGPRPQPQPQPQPQPLPGPGCTGCDLHCQGQGRLVDILCLRSLSSSLPCLGITVL